MSERRRALFVDRDGILNEVVRRGDGIGSPRCWEEFRLVAEAVPLLQACRAAGYVTVLVTNQPDVTRGKLSQELLDEFHARLTEAMPLDSLEVCTAGSDDDRRRKPNPGMLLDAASRLTLDLSSCFFLGDSYKDVEAGRRAGVRTILLRTDYNQETWSLADHVVEKLEDCLPILAAEG